MKSHLLILVTLFISTSCWSQIDMKALASKYPEYANRINTADEFLKSIGIDLGDKNQMDFQIKFNRHIGNNIYYFQCNNGPVAIVAIAKSKADISFYPQDLFSSLPSDNLNSILERQKSGEILTDLFNLNDIVTTETDGKSRMIQEVRIPVNPDDKTIEKKVFKGPILILVTLDPTKQLWVEWKTFDKMNIMEFNGRYTRESNFRNAYDYLTYRRDFRNSLALYIGAKDPYISDVALVNKIMNKLSAELKQDPLNVSEGSIYILSHPQITDFLEKVSSNHPEYKEFYSYVKQWNEEFAKYAMGVIYLKSKDEIKESRKTEFFGNLLNEIEGFKSRTFEAK